MCQNKWLKFCLCHTHICTCTHTCFGVHGGLNHMVGKYCPRLGQCHTSLVYSLSSMLLYDGAHRQNADKMVALSLTLPWRIVKKLGDHCSSFSTVGWDRLEDHFCIPILYKSRLGLPEWFSCVYKHVHQVIVEQKWQKAGHTIPYPCPVSVITNYITPMINLPSLSLHGTSVGWEPLLQEAITSV